MVSEYQSFVGKKGWRATVQVCLYESCNCWKICSLCEHFMRSQGIIHAMNYALMICSEVHCFSLMVVDGTLVERWARTDGVPMSKGVKSHNDDL